MLSPMPSPKLIFVGPDGSLREADAEGDGARLLTRPWTTKTVSRYAWPCLRPDGRRFACFSRSEEPYAPAEVLIVDATGVEMWQVLRAAGEVPIYAGWSPDGQTLAVLLQGREALRLVLLSPQRSRVARTVCEGRPVFLAWSPDSQFLAVHSGRSDGPGRVRLFDVSAENGAGRPISDAAGGFRVPAWSRTGELAFAEGDADSVELRIQRADGQVEVAHRGAGTIAFLWSPSGRALAIGRTDRDRTSFGRLEICERTGSRAQVPVEDAIAFGWMPDDRGLWVASIEAEDMCLGLWSASARGEPPRRLARFLPSRETVFELSFFDQYACSHPRVSPDGGSLLFCGSEPERGADAPAVYAVPVNGAGPRRLADGDMAAWRR
jgi:Tol biopolymer transport system component